MLTKFKSLIFLQYDDNFTDERLFPPIPEKTYLNLLVLLELGN